MRFAFRTAGEILFGRGESKKAPELAARYGRRLFLVTGSASVERSGLLAQLEEGLRQAGVSWVRWRVGREPDVDLVDAGAALCRAESCDVVLAVGGGSALDAAKAISGLATNPGSVQEYLEDLPGGDLRTVTNTPLPLLCVPTTAGTGSEVTRNAVIKVPAYSVKRSMRHDLLLPRVAIVDPDLIGSAPPSVIAAAGMDALTHLAESYLSRAANPMTDALALPGLRLIIPALRTLAAGSATPETWEALALASLWGGVCLANAGLGAVHGLVAPLGGCYEVPHGAGCAALLPAVTRTNLAALRSRAPESPALARYAQLFAAFGASDEERGVAAVEGLVRALGIPPLRRYGVTAAGFARIIAGARGSSMRGNPVELTDQELETVLSEAL